MYTPSLDGDSGSKFPFCSGQKKAQNQKSRNMVLPDFLLSSPEILALHVLSLWSTAELKRTVKAFDKHRNHIAISAVYLAPGYWTDMQLLWEPVNTQRVFPRNSKQCSDDTYKTTPSCIGSKYKGDNTSNNDNDHCLPQRMSSVAKPSINDSTGQKRLKLHIPSIHTGCSPRPESSSPPAHDDVSTAVALPSPETLWTVQLRFLFQQIQNIGLSRSCSRNRYSSFSARSSPSVTNSKIYNNSLTMISPAPIHPIPNPLVIGRPDTAYDAEASSPGERQDGCASSRVACHDVNYPLLNRPTNGRHQRYDSNPSRLDRSWTSALTPLFLPKQCLQIFASLKRISIREPPCGIGTLFRTLDIASARQIESIEIYMVDNDSSSSRLNIPPQVLHAFKDTFAVTTGASSSTCIAKTSHPFSEPHRQQSVTCDHRVPGMVKPSNPAPASNFQPCKGASHGATRHALFPFTCSSNCCASCDASACQYLHWCVPKVTSNPDNVSTQRGFPSLTKIVIDAPVGTFDIMQIAQAISPCIELPRLSMACLVLSRLYPTVLRIPRSILSGDEVANNHSAADDGLSQRATATWVAGERDGVDTCDLGTTTQLPTENTYVDVTISDALCLLLHKIRKNSLRIFTIKNTLARPKPWRDPKRRLQYSSHMTKLVADHDSPELLYSSQTQHVLENAFKSHDPRHKQNISLVKVTFEDGVYFADRIPREAMHRSNDLLHPDSFYSHLFEDRTFFSDISYGGVATSHSNAHGTAVKPRIACSTGRDTSAFQVTNTSTFLSDLILRGNEPTRSSHFIDADLESAWGNDSQRPLDLFVAGTDVCASSDPEIDIDSFGRVAGDPSGDAAILHDSSCMYYSGCDSPYMPLVIDDQSMLETALTELSYLALQVRTSLLANENQRHHSDADNINSIIRDQAIVTNLNTRNVISRVTSQSLSNVTCMTDQHVVQYLLDTQLASLDCLVAPDMDSNARQFRQIMSGVWNRGRELKVWDLPGWRILQTISIES